MPAFLVLAVALALVIAGVLTLRGSDDQSVPSARTDTTAGESTGTTSVPVTAGPGTTTRNPTSTAPSPGTPTTILGSGGQVRQGTWGGRGIKVVLTDRGGSVEFECASGDITAPLVVDRGGSFQAGGTYSSLRGGPPDPAAPAPRAQPARYSGSVDGTQMRLTVSLTETGASLGPFTLGLDQQPLLDRCG